MSGATDADGIVLTRVALHSALRLHGAFGALQLQQQ